MENGEYKVGLDTLFRILQVFELSMSTFFEEAAPEIDDSGSHAEIDSEGESSGMAATGVAALPKDERDQLVSDLTELSEESRREVREFISFKRMQAESRRPIQQPKWKPESTESVESTDVSGEHVSPDSGSSPDSGGAPDALNGQPIGRTPFRRYREPKGTYRPGRHAFGQRMAATTISST